MSALKVSGKTTWWIGETVENNLKTLEILENTLERSERSKPSVPRRSTIKVLSRLDGS